MKNKNKKAQITMFVIAGIVILFAVALLVYWQNSFNKVRPPVQQLLVDDSVKPVQQYVTDCLNAISKDALIRLGQNGGYIDIPSGLKINPAKPHDSDVLFFPPQNIPYWYYGRPCEESSVPCIYIRDPPVCKNGVDCALPYRGQNSMEEQLNVFVEENLQACIDDFRIFNDRFDIDSGDVKVDAKITEDLVWFKMDYPLSISVKGTSQKIDIPYFYTEHELKLKEMYEFAREIRDAQANYTFLERNTLNLITVYSGIDSNSLPPMSGVEMFNPGAKKIWIRSTVKEQLQSDILPYTMLLQIVNAGNYQEILPRGTDPKYISFEEGLYKGMAIQVSNTSMHPDLDANLYYPPDSEIYFRIGDSEIIKPKNYESENNIILKIMNYAVNDYSFKYDLTYPVIVTISDPEAFNGQGYKFSYAIQANIRQNVPITKNMTVTSVLTTPSIDVEDTNHRVERSITIETFDKYTKEPLGDVQINYRCGYDVVIGMTEVKSGKASLTEKFPFCQFGGEILYEKAGYMGGAIDYTNTEGSDPQNFRIELWPMQEKKFKVYKRTVEDINSIRNVGAGGIVLYNTAFTNISENDTVFLNIYRHKTDVRETDVPLVGFSVYKPQGAILKTLTKQDQIDYLDGLLADNLINQTVRDSLVADLNIADNTPQTQVVQQSDEDTYVMEFVPGTYSIDAFMMYDGIIQIPAMTQKMCGQKVLGVCVFGDVEV
ncbi:MAG TPA: hypothetical protein VEC16_02585, partial [Alphaproteobacteria bacterium]|nr:hypothetical protein [Alphaproteobacteria bacterium]